MADTPTYHWALPDVGASSDTWGGTLNDAFVAADEQVAANAAAVGETLLASGAATNQATLDIALSGGYGSYRLVLTRIEPDTTAQQLQARVSIDGGSTYKAGASDYSFAGQYSDSSSASGHFQGPTASSIALQPGGGVTSDPGYSPSLDILIFPAVAGSNIALMWNGWGADASLNLQSYRGGGRSVWSSATNLRLFYGSGNIAQAKWALFGIAGL